MVLVTEDTELIFFKKIDQVVSRQVPCIKHIIIFTYYLPKGHFDVSQKPHLYVCMYDPLLSNSVGHQGCCLLLPVIHASYFFPRKVNGNLHSSFDPEVVLHTCSSPTEVAFTVVVVVIVVLVTEENNAQINGFFTVHINQNNFPER